MPYQRILERLDKLLAQGEKVLSTKKAQSLGIISVRGSYVDSELFLPWRASIFSFIRMVFNEEHSHFGMLQDGCEHSYYQDALVGQSVLKAAKEDIEAGYLKSLESMVAADIFTDFMEMAEHLLASGYKDPAASLIGAVLEDGLGKICAENGITLKSRENISSLNKKLADKNIYNRIIQRSIHAWNELRDHADHGNFGEYDTEMVKQMLDGVRDFLGKHL